MVYERFCDKDLDVSAHLGLSQLSLYNMLSCGEWYMCRQMITSFECSKLDSNYDVGVKHVSFAHGCVIH